MAENRPFRGHRYLPTGERDEREMLEAVGASSLADLFSSLPPEILRPEAPPIDGPLSDQELRRRFGAMEGRNQVGGRDLASFLGGGAYRHEIPALIDSMLTRSEFLTVYTPYQPEVSQGTLQAIFEFQTFISILTGLPVANASLYEGASAFAEAVLMADRLQRKRRKVLVARSIHPHYRQVLNTYVQNLDLEVREIGWGADGRVDLEQLEAELDEETACVAVQSPNYFGVLEPWNRVSGPAHEKGALSIGVVAEALSLALLQSPGEGGCDIAVGEAQSYGVPLSYGGPYLGFMAAKDQYKRALPGRLVGQTVDVEGERAFVLTLATREQHIRREKATSNICTNQALCALAATVYLALHGKQGLRRLAEINLQRAAALRRRLTSLAGFEGAFSGPCFNEFLLRSREPVPQVLGRLQEAGILGGIPLEEHYPELADTFLVAVTECNPPAELDFLVERLAAQTVAEETLPVTV